MMRTSDGRLGRRFLRDAAGASAVEFALIAPLLILFYFGMAETCQLMMAQRRVSHAAAAMADLVSQGGELDTKERDDIFLAGRMMLAPFPTTGFSVRLTSVKRNDNNQNLAVWSEISGSALTATAKNAPVAIKTPIDKPGESVILAEVAFNHVSPIGYVMPGVMKLTHSAELRPRRTDEVVRCQRATATSPCVPIA